ncbi:MAG: hypothetical protein U9N14_00410 [Pseudomonadota bacterium]|nr:hypothetical protein [Pseudomonadota bacterium]
MKLTRTILLPLAALVMMTAQPVHAQELNIDAFNASNEIYGAGIYNLNFLSACINHFEPNDDEAAKIIASFAMEWRDRNTEIIQFAEKTREMFLEQHTEADFPVKQTTSNLNDYVNKLIAQEKLNVESFEMSCSQTVNAMALGVLDLEQTSPAAHKILLEVLADFKANADEAKTE